MEDVQNQQQNDQQQQQQTEQVVSVDEQRENEEMRNEEKAKEIEMKLEEIEKKKRELFQKVVYLTLKGKGLEQLSDVFNVQDIDTLNKQIEIVEKFMNNRIAQNSYKPNDHKPNDAYAQYQKEKNVGGMISTKLANLFK